MPALRGRPHRFDRGWARGEKDAAPQDPGPVGSFAGGFVRGPGFFHLVFCEASGPVKPGGISYLLPGDSLSAEPTDPAGDFCTSRNESESVCTWMTRIEPPADAALTSRLFDGNGDAASCIFAAPIPWAGKPGNRVDLRRFAPHGKTLRRNQVFAPHVHIGGVNFSV